MKVTVNKYLNVRVGSPSVNAPCYQYLAPGSELEIDGKTYPGDSYDANNLWFRDEANNYYWSGGVEFPNEIKALNLLGTRNQTFFDWWHKEFNIPKVWELLENKGEGVNIAMIDSGIDYNHPYLKRTKIKGKSIVGNKNEYMDNWNHGTMVSSIIAANGADLIGIAPQANLYAIKIFDKYGCEEDDFIEGISIVPDNVDLVCITQSKGYLENQILSKRFISAFEKIRTTLIICSAGNNISRKIFSEELPAALPNTISVSSVKAGGLISEASSMSQNITLSAPGDNVKCVAAGEKMRHYRGPVSGTSFSAPFVAGVIALGISYIRRNRKTISEPRIKEILINTCQGKNNRNLYGSGVINPLEFANQIINE